MKKEPESKPHPNPPLVGEGVLPLSVFIIAKNEADRIHYPIESVKGWVDEIIVIDSGSTDGTMEKAQELGADQVVFREWEGYGPQKIHGESLCRNDWLLNLDADEQVDPALREKIITLFAQPMDENTAYAINNVMVFPHDDAPVDASPSGYVVRLYNKLAAGFKDSTVHDSVTANTDHKLKIIQLKEPINHFGFRSLTHWVEKINFYSSMQAEDLHRRGKRPSGARMVVEPFITFFKAYFMRGYWRSGVDGVFYSVIYAFARSLRLAKTREIYKLEKKKEQRKQA